jgi:ABC-type transport system substrate-binding protein
MFRLTSSPTRDGLVWHDGQPVTTEDCVVSIKRWAAKDATGQKLMTFVSGFEIKDAKTFLIKLNEPTGLVLLGLGKPSSNVPFMMPKRVAETDPNTQISDFTGSGPFVFKREEWKPATRRSTSSSTSMCHAPNQPRVSLAVRSPCSTEWNGPPSPPTSRP